jgi:hypothetical protein
MAVTCDTILILPSDEAPKPRPRVEAKLRRPGHRQLAADDHGHDPRRREAKLHERDERGRREELVGNGIHHPAERGDLPAAPREVAIEPVGDRRQPEDGGADDRRGDAEKRLPLELGQQDDDQQGDQKDPRDRERIRQVH